MSTLSSSTAQLSALESTLAAASSAETAAAEHITGGEVRVAQAARNALDAHLLATHAATCPFPKEHKHADARQVVLPFFGLHSGGAVLQRLNDLMLAEHTRIAAANQGQRVDAAERMAEVSQALILAMTEALEASAKRPAKLKKKD